MTATLLVIAALLLVLGVAAMAGDAVARPTAIAAATASILMLSVSQSLVLDAGPLERSIATAAEPLVLALALVAALGILPATTVALVGAVIAGPVRQAFADPFHDPRCTLDCDPNPLVLVPYPAVADYAQLVGNLVILGALIACAPIGGRRVAILVPSFLIAWWATLNDPPAGVALAGLLAVAGLGTDLLLTTTRTARLAAAAAALAPADDVERVFGDAVGAPALAFAYPVAGGRFVDGSGRRLPPTAAPTTDISSPRGPIVQIRGDLSGIAPTAIARALDGPVRLAFETRRLAAESAMQSLEIEESAARLVSAAADRRRSLERDLHDGAQRHVLTLGLALRSAPGLDEGTRAEGTRIVRSVLDQLRDAAHGLRPPQLDTGGLQHAWAAIAQRSDVPVEVSAVPADLSGPVAEVAYRLLGRCVDSATGPVIARVDSTASEWIAVVSSARDGAIAPSTSDLVRALGGELVSERIGEGWAHRAWFPRRSI